MTPNVRDGFKVLTHDGRPPVQGGDPLCALNVMPVAIGPVDLDTSLEECARGLNYCADLSTALRIAGLWPNGRPSRAFAVEASADAIERGNKRRASSLTLVREVTETEIEAVVVQLSAPFHPFTDAIVAEQMAWRHALSRPSKSVVEVERNLNAALSARGVSWSLRRFPDARAVWAARAAWAAWAAWDAWDALTVWYAAKQGWTNHNPALLTTGLRDAYANGLAIAIPSGPNELGWAMVDDGAVSPDGEQKA